jgi:hypothetical protein
MLAALGGEAQQAHRHLAEFGEMGFAHGYGGRTDQMPLVATHLGENGALVTPALLKGATTWRSVRHRANSGPERR